MNPYKAGKFRADESSGEKQSQQVDSRYDIFEGENGDGRTTDKYVRGATYSHWVPLATSSVATSTGYSEQIFFTERTLPLDIYVQKVWLQSMHSFMN